ncbi:inositol phosphorylceramide synthase [Maritimibacter sp. 55A14]|uniref:phosphatase PAP2 family protein n=1 Tax=Maritimibacter sp. 55A14 TaxID=2174844 RepID=UPI000D6109CD|nr:phosphatase PAP2 family protein [Maritimibacter sp. 55A14]PWE33290.1 inositol phosphorylceramide synthase [Maritimibacter sp. 55A14]
MTASETGRRNPDLQGFMKRHGLFAGLIGVHSLAAMTTARFLGLAYDNTLMQSLATLFGVMIPLFLMILCVRTLLLMAVFERPARPLDAFVGKIRGVLVDPERMIGGAFALFCLVVFFDSFTYFKTVIPHVQPFDWDVAFAEFDRLLHFGYHPYELLKPLLGTPEMTTFINGVYHFWLFLTYFVLFLVCFSVTDQRRRMTFLLAFVLTWAIGGNLLAMAFSSAGPVYYQGLGFGETFVPLMDMLNRFNEVSPVWALNVQDLLWEGYLRDDRLAGGISAMPSMHLASSTLLALCGFAYARWAGLLLSLFTFLILLGSVHLGWHYAVDGYAGIILAILCWKLAARLSRHQPANAQEKAVETTL